MQAISAIATALALGAAAGLKDVTARAIGDGYAALKKWIASNLPSVLPSVEHLERAPESKARRAMVEEDLDKAGAVTNGELLAQAEMLLTLIEHKAPMLGEAIGVTLKDIQGASLSIADVRSGGSGVVVENAQIEGAIEISGVRAGSGGTGDPNA